MMRPVHAIWVEIIIELSCCTFLALALKYMRDKNVTHLDLKPQNILLSSRSRPKLKIAGKMGKETHWRFSPTYMEIFFIIPSQCGYLKKLIISLIKKLIKLTCPIILQILVLHTSLLEVLTPIIWKVHLYIWHLRSSAKNITTPKLISGLLV